MAGKMQLLSFDNLSQRVLYRYAFGFADFVPIESDAVSIDAQRALYELFAALVCGVADDPALLGLPVDCPDQWMKAHHVMNMYPELYKVRNACQKSFHEFFGLLFAAGLHGSHRDERIIARMEDLPKLTKKKLDTYIQLLAGHGVLAVSLGDSMSFALPACPQALAAWQLLAAMCAEYPKRQVISFALWNHSADGAYFLERIGKLLGLDEDFFEYVSQKYLARGYAEQFDVDENGTKYVYAKEIGGLNVEYTTLWPTVRFVNKTSIGIKAALEHADELADELKDQLVQFCKRCNDCMGCTKGGKNRQFTVTVHCTDGDYRLCPEFVQMEWFNADISREKIDLMLELNELQERFGKAGKKKGTVAR